MVCITELPLELIEHILYLLDPLHVSYIAQSARFFRELIYGATQCQRFWRGLYLAQPLDDPRNTITYLGSPRARVSPTYRMVMNSTMDMSQFGPILNPLSSPVAESNIDWHAELQRIIRARTVVLNPYACRKGELKEVLQTLLDLATTLPLLPFAESECSSRNVIFVLGLLQDGAFLDIGRGDEGIAKTGHGPCRAGHIQAPEQEQSEWTWAPPNIITFEESQMLARLHTWVGLTKRDVHTPHRRLLSRAFVYDLRNYSSANAYGPFLPDGSMRVDWTHVQVLAHVYCLLWIDMESEECAEYGDLFDLAVTVNGIKWPCPFSLPMCQSVIPSGMELDVEKDWAGVEGLWWVGYGFLDHREFLVYNYSNLSFPDMSIFEGDDVPETHASLRIYFRVTSVEPDPDHPTRPKIHFAGELDGKFSVTGFVKVTPDDQSWWHFNGGNGDGNSSGDNNHSVWSCEGIGLGGVRSQAGVLGVWSTVFHDKEDPLGPFWMYRQKFIED